MSLVTELQDYREKTKDRPFLGEIVWFSARAALIPYSKLKTDLASVGLERHCPSPTAVSDEWRKATSAANRKGVDIGDGKKLNVMVRQLADDDKEIVRSLVVETVDENNVRLDYRESHHVVFEKQREIMVLRRLIPAWEQSPADEVAQELQASFNARRGHVDQDTIRALLKNVLVAHKAVTVRETGGVLFVSREHSQVVADLERLADGWSGADLHALPLVDDEVGKQRDMVASGVTSGVFTEVDALMAEVREHKADMSKRRSTSIIRRYKEIQARVESYKNLLEDDLGAATDRLQVLGLALPQILDAAA